MDLYCGVEGVKMPASLLSALLMRAAAEIPEMDLHPVSIRFVNEEEEHEVRPVDAAAQTVVWSDHYCRRCC
jgi:hypothetical protein